MAKKTITFELTVEIDETVVGKPARIWFFQMLNRIGYEEGFLIKKLKYKNKVVDISSNAELSDLPLKKEDRIA